MPEGAPLESLRIPELPPASADFNSFIAAVTAGAISREEIFYRLRAQDGYARTVNGLANVPSDLRDVIAAGVSNPYFQTYAQKAVRGRRVNRGLLISLAFNRGRLQFRDPGDRDDKGRTFVEAL